MTKEGTENLLVGIVKQAKHDFFRLYGSTNLNDICEFETLIKDLHSAHFQRITNGAMESDAIIKEWKKQAQYRIYERIAEMEKKKEKRGNNK